MIWTADELTPREQEIIKNIKQLVEDTSCDMYNHGYDEGYEAADAETSYDRGWNDALEGVMEIVEKTGFVYTPTNRVDMKKQLEAHKDNGPLCVMMYMNYLAEQIESIEK